MLRTNGLKPHVVIDMTPLEGHGQNGGAGLLAVSLVRHLSELAHGWRFTLLTSSDSHVELAGLDGPNVQRRCVVTRQPARSVARRLADTLLPGGVRARLKRAYGSSRTQRYSRLTGELEPDLLFCPFSVPYFWREGVPCVSIVHDLQHLAYPEFFSDQQRLNRQEHLAAVCARCERVICISEYVRSTLLASMDVSSDRVVSIHVGLLQECPAPDTTILSRLGLNQGEFLLYPANFWPHKNHRRLFEALQVGSNRPMKLVCTGAPNAFMRMLEQDARQMLPSATVVFAGYVSTAELTGLMEHCAAVVFPSLYEGFGIPVLEAMAHGKPVLCSNVTSLPEVAGDAAIYFDPTSPDQIAAAIAELDDRSRVADLALRGRQRAAELGTARAMAARYKSVFEQVLATRAA